MRVTQAMLSQNTLRHISQGYDRLGQLQDQLASQKKITRAHQDPVVAMNGMRYRTQVTEVDQFKRNIGEVYNWMDTADSTLDKTTQALHRIRELIVQASNDTYEDTQRTNIGKEVTQIREHIASMANTKSNNKYIFNGTDTLTSPVDMKKMDMGIEEMANFPNDSLEVAYNGRIYTFDEEANAFVNGTRSITIGANHEVHHTYPDPDDPTNVIAEELLERDIVISPKNAVSENKDQVQIELLKGVSMPVNINPANVFSNALFGDILRLEKMLNDPTTTGSELTGMLDNLDKHIDQFVAERAELGARVNRVEMIDNRLMEQEVIAKRIMSQNEDADIEKVIIELMTQESAHRAALSAGARIMQPTLMDFLR
ncbi:flagellar hook protein [Alkalihalophilus pseudofirmus]|uniref:flagellar hook-associated protein FlgL n=1 Tax=Alkalihalobacterium alkalinitrilicum TaxID=427920 RepID=UPI00094C3E60|nr:flagellar hook-associated protein FlgL [Alkalihalobacterium alkalinitrilicum]OLO38091.1 flagellar hook protein [Alkalihalophilus pseudofirmus]